MDASVDGLRRIEREPLVEGTESPFRQDVHALLGVLPEVQDLTRVPVVDGLVVVPHPDDRVAAVHGGRWWVLKIGYDERWAEHSPGIQLMWDVLREAFEQRLTSFEMLGSAEPWLTIWTREQRTYRTLAFYPYNGRGMVALSADIMRAFAQRARSKLAGKIRVKAASTRENGGTVAGPDT